MSSTAKEIMDKLSVGALKVKRSLAFEIGLNNAIILQTIRDLEKADNVVTLEMLQDELMFFGIKTFNTSLKKLETSLYITIEYLNASDKMNILLKKDLKGLGIGNKRCPICNCKTLTLHEHHYPIQKCDGGTETIAICPTCHYEYHHLSVTRIIKCVVTKEGE